MSRRSVSNAASRLRRSSSRSGGSRSCRFVWNSPPPPGTNGAWRAADLPGGQEVAGRDELLLGVRQDRLGEEDHVGRHAAGRVVRARDAAVDRAEVRVQEVLVDQRLEVVVAVAGPVGADDCELVGQLRQAREGAAEGDAGQRGGDLAGDAADAVRGRHLGVEGLDLGRPAVQEQEDDRLARGQRFGRPAARAWNTSGSVRPPSARPPMRRNSRRLKPGRGSGR